MLFRSREFDEVLSWSRGSDETVHAVERRDQQDDQMLEPWSKEEEDRFCRGASPAEVKQNTNTHPNKRKSRPKLPDRHDVP